MDGDLKTFLIPNELCRRAGIAASWIPTNRIGVFPSQKPPKRDHPTAYATDKAASIFHLQQDVILFKPILRNLVNEANGAFLSVQDLRKSNPNDKRAHVLNLSRQYRSIIRACLENLQEEILKSNSNTEELQNYITIFYSTECIWHLCEILFMDVIPGQAILPLFLEWVRFHFPKYERNATVLLAGSLVGLETHPEYWETVIGSTLQGRISVVRRLLAQHSDADTLAFKMVDQCLKAMPIYRVFGPVSANEFKLQWRHWLVDVQAKIDAKMFISCYNLNLIMKLVVGDEVAWGEIQQYCETWYELLAAWLFFTCPTVKSFELGQHAKQCLSKMSIRNRMKHLDRVLLAAMEFDIIQVIKEIQQMTENGWFVTHLTDLLYHSGRLQELSANAEGFSPARLRESLIIDYGILLMGHKSLWQVGISYLDCCPKDGLKTIKLLLSRVPLDSELKAKRVVREALVRNLEDVAQNICKVEAMICKNYGRLGSALTWAIKSKDSPFIASLVHHYLEEYLATGTIKHADLLNNLRSSILASDRLIFLGKYCEFHKLYQEKNFKEAARVLVSLMDSKLVPKYFWSVLLADAIPLLEAENMVFSFKETLLIIHCLEENENTIKTNQDTLDILREATRRNLARAIVEDISAK